MFELFVAEASGGAVGLAWVGVGVASEEVTGAVSGAEASVEGGKNGARAVAAGPRSWRLPCIKRGKSIAVNAFESSEVGAADGGGLWMTI